MLIDLVLDQGDSTSASKATDVHLDQKKCRRSEAVKMVLEIILERESFFNEKAIFQSKSLASVLFHKWIS